ncbi:uncharacterized protein (TIGR02271 family) [Paenarthrobacter nicotinovorans]|uniref:Uncharacterized protein (TIGR02271 family) n=1 Tax=Paenarthrobacter nicotinovorans TaxID=29320 RepID=A0ABT9TRF4_PAENI|nr:PRC and DUF2382 domain-containing protein [Paenarthrobacter nicotinovorans]MDQ0103127.1 uncharacterized protein (TIGR02271 family) [Paenarthrobacter nicotinovorans]GAT88455.1 photosystem reaction center subunit H [Paenarthrobacter nicotinovorans]
MLTRENIDRLMGLNGDVRTTEGDKVGSIGTFYTDDDTGEPTWVTVKTGLFGSSESFIPLDEATVDGDDVVVPFTKDHIKDAPRVAEDGHLDPGEESRLYNHYGLEDRGVSGQHQGDYAASRDTETSRGVAGTQREPGQGDGENNAMTRSEERLNVGTEKEATGKARLRKYITTENVTTTVPVQREEVRLEREPITDGNAGDAMPGPELTESEHEVTLHQERPVVEKETVPVERVRLEKDTVTDDVQVDEEIRKEHIETEGTNDDRRR